MAGSLTRYGESLMLNLAFRKAQTSSTVVAPTNLYIGLTTSSIVDTDTLLSIQAIEETDTNYRRAQITFNAPTIDGSVTKILNTGGQIAFGPWAADAPSSITHCFITDTVSRTDTTGNILAWMNLTVAKQPGSGDMLVFYEGDVKFTLN